MDYEKDAYFRSHHLGKRLYDNKHDARVVIQRMKRSGKVLDGDRLRVYKCKFCMFYHIGRKEKSTIQ